MGKDRSWDEDFYKAEGAEATKWLLLLFKFFIIERICLVLANNCAYAINFLKK